MIDSDTDRRSLYHLIRSQSMYSAKSECDYITPLLQRSEHRKAPGEDVSQIVEHHQGWGVNLRSCGCSRSVSTPRSRKHGSSILTWTSQRLIIDPTRLPIHQALSQRIRYRRQDVRDILHPRNLSSSREGNAQQTRRDIAARR